MKNKISLLLCFIVLFTSPISAASFGPENLIISNANGIDRPSSLISTDMDSDGDMDVFFSADTKIGWYKNVDGQGNFESMSYTVATFNPNDLLTAHVTDIDGDGDIDIVATIRYQYIIWFENIDGLGNFGPQQIIYNEFSSGRVLYAVDIDGDEDMDILSTTSGEIVWYENTDGNGTFDNKEVISTNVYYVKSIYATDIDGDGDMDVLSATPDFISWHENTDGVGTFEQLQVITTLVGAAESVFAADIDGDGDQDVLSASNDKVAWYENTDGFGSFGSQQIIPGSNDLASRVYSADLDGDGDMDVLSASSAEDNIAWNENTDGNGSFSQQKIITQNAEHAGFIDASDIDGDGDMDVISGSWGDISWFENTDGNGAFDSQVSLTQMAYGACSVYAADLDGDGDMDVLSASQNDDKIAWYENIDGNGNFGIQQVISTSALSAQSVYAADLDGDGDMDVLSASEGDKKIAWYENTNGFGAFGSQQIISYEADYVSAVIAADFDSDGDLDVIQGANPLGWYENVDGQGMFSDIHIIDTWGGTSIYTIDIDGDGDIDVLSERSWYENINGEGEFGQENIITDFAYIISAVFAGDLDEDGDTDVIMGSFDGDSDESHIHWYENLDGTGNFGLTQIIGDYAGRPRSLFSADFDDDGDLDVISANQWGWEIAYYGNLTGDTDYWPKQLINSSARDARSVYATDIDGDGDIDVLSASEGDNKIAWYANLKIVGTGTLKQNEISVYPNPTNGKIKIDLGQENIQLLKITDLVGNVLFEKKEVSQQETIDLAGFPSGIYILMIQTENRLLTKKIVKQ